ncbi:MAG TPA: type IV secretory system conjugative DNA transfer family protein [Candidatus Paceibacterota bacterium]|nr:type IV secretory system conjugative DNA transfer family protein [Candidatus Paceibacterota bacterium]HMO83094.1 type IV secretory system conjugative DNA transfer family protein [Candidatus Paceibacterota bacterium]
MTEGLPKQFSSPEEELKYLREKVVLRERELMARNAEVDHADTETIVRQELKEYASFTPKMILDREHALDEPALAASIEQAIIARDPVREIIELAQEKGIRNALSVLEKIDNAYVVDEVHRQLIEAIRGGAVMQDLRENVPPWQLLSLTLYEVTLPEVKGKDGHEYQLAELVGMMEQLFAGLRTIGAKQSENHFAFEIAVADNSDDIVFYVAVPSKFTSLFEKQTLSLFPHAELMVKVHDYNIFVDQGVTVVAEAKLKKHPIYPLRTADGFSSDPLSVILNAFSKIEREGGGAAVQFVMRHPQKQYRKNYEEVIKNVQKGMKASDAISRSTLGGEILGSISDLFFDKKSKTDTSPSSSDSEKVEVFSRKIKTDIIETNIRIAVSATSPDRVEQIITEIESTFNQFDIVDGNAITFKRLSGSALKRGQKAFVFREFSSSSLIPLSLAEISTMIHFPSNGILSSPQFKQSQSNTGAAPNDLPTSGTLLGVNKHRNTEKEIYMTELDRMRHLYVIGQTGTGKSKFLTNIIIQDIQAGNGVCMIDPHGTDIEDVLGAIPESRIDDVIYFDPSNLDRAVGLNMLEYDINKPEQKTFVVNELFSIFQKLYGANPESMGPMFEQYFRNATLLVMEDPDSGSTLMDISRVMADAAFRKMKLEKAKNPVVVQFWREIATKAGGEASLENIVPYIVSKFDVFTANDYMRPIIGQQKSAFNFRQVMDEKKILLVNLSKGRLGEINANLIGMIFVGKILMAALSRVDDATKSFPPFYLHIDEFQNVSTPAIASILSEARKYKLSLTMAHQFIAQLDEEIKDAVFGNVGSMAAFRIGSEDAQFLEQQFSPVFEAKDLMNVPNYNALIRMLANGTPTKPFSIKTLPPIVSDPSRLAAIIEASTLRYGRPREEVEAEIAERYVKKPVVSPFPSAMM